MILFSLVTATPTAEKQATPVPVMDTVRELLKEAKHRELVIEIVAKLLRANELLTRRIAEWFSKHHKSETINPNQLQLLLEELQSQPKGNESEANDRLQEAADAESKDDDQGPKPPKQPAVRKPAPAHLERVPNPIAVPEKERPCPQCGSERKCVGHETTEVIELIPAKIIVREDIREVLSCGKCDGEMVRAPAADKVVSGGKYGPNLIADLVVGKYEEGLPLDRQRRSLAHLGLLISTGVMSDQIGWTTDLLKPLWRRIGTLVLDSEVMHMDPTFLPVRDKATGHQVQLGSLWGYVGVNGEGDSKTLLGFYHFTSTGKQYGQREGEIGPLEFLSKRSGPIVCDASNMFDAVFKRDDLDEAGCNAHARRKFVAALDAGDARAAIAIKAFASLYAIEASITTLSIEQRKLERQARSRPIYDELIRWCMFYKGHEPPRSRLAIAASYLLKQQIALTRFIDDGQLPIDNNIIERQHRYPAIGRRNYLFAGSFTGGERAAIAYTILACCRYAGVDPRAYLADVLPKLNRARAKACELDALMPANWKAARSQSA
jgi:transposase